MPNTFDNQALRDRYPMLEVRGEGPRKISGVALASKNIKRLLSQEFPGVKFSVKSDIYANGSSIYVYWTEFPGQEGLGKKINEMVYPFQYGRFNGMDDSQSSDTDPGRRAFRELFGGAQNVISQTHRPTAAEQAAYEAAKLNANTSQVPVAQKPKAPGRF